MLSASPFKFALQVIHGRWFMIFASFLVMSAAGATYIFAVYSQDIKSTLGYNQQQLNTIAFFKDIGANVGMLAAIIGDLTPPWIVLTIGAAMNLSGYLMIYLAITGRTNHTHLWQMCLYICIGANSQTFATTGVLVTSVKNYPESRGIVLGLLKGFVGLSGAVFTQLYLAFYGHDSKSLVLLIAWLPAAISAVFVPTIRIIRDQRRQSDEYKVFCSFLYISLILAFYLMVVIIVQKMVTFTHTEYSVSAVIILLLLLLPLVTVINQQIKIFRQEKLQALPNPGVVSVVVEQNPSAAQEPDLKEPKLDTSTVNLKESNALISRLSKALKSPPLGEDYSILQALVSFDMLILFFATLCGVGSTLTAIDNMGQIGQSLGYPNRTISTFVSLISIWNYTGRVSSGFLSELLLSRYKLPRPLLLVFVMVLSCAGHLLIAFRVPGSLYLASVIVGFCFGAQMPLLLAIISEFFGLRYFATFYNIAGLAMPVASYVLNVRIAGYLYDREAAKQNAGKYLDSIEKALTCMGVQCFRLSFLIITAVTMLGALAMLILVWRTKDFYKGDIYAKFRDENLQGDDKMERKVELVTTEK